MAAGAAMNGVGTVRAGSTGTATCIGAGRYVIAILQAATIGMAVTAESSTATGTARDLRMGDASAARTSAFGKMAGASAAASLAARKLSRHSRGVAKGADALPGANVGGEVVARTSTTGGRAAAKAVGRAPRVVDVSVVRALFVHKRVADRAIVRAAEIAAGKAVTARSEPNHRHSRVSH